MFIFKETGVLFLGTILKRLSEKFFQDLPQIYKNRNTDFKPACFPLFYFLSKKSVLTIFEVVQELKITKSGASQSRSLLEKKNLIEIVKSGNDKRVKSIRLTRKGQKMLTSIKPIWQSIKKACLKFYMIMDFYSRWIEGHLMGDHVHLVISILPKYAVSQVVGYIKEKSAIHIARTYVERRYNFTGQNFWA